MCLNLGINPELLRQFYGHTCQPPPPPPPLPPPSPPSPLPLFFPHLFGECRSVRVAECVLETLLNSFYLFTTKTSSKTTLKYRIYSLWSNLSISMCVLWCCFFLCVFVCMCVSVCLCNQVAELTRTIQSFLAHYRSFYSTSSTTRTMGLVAGESGQDGGTALLPPPPLHPPVFFFRDAVLRQVCSS